MEAKEKPKPRKDTIRRILGLARAERGSLLLGTLFLLIGGAAQLVFPQSIRIIIDEALANGRLEVIDQVALVMGGVFLVQGVATALRYILFHTAGERIVNRLREQLYGRLLDQEIAFFDERRIGELTSRLSSDTTVLQSAASFNISILLRNLTLIAGGLAFLFYTSVRLTLVMLTIVPVVAVGAVVYGRKVRKLARQVQDSFAEASQVVSESLVGIRTVRTFTAEKYELGRYRDALVRTLGLARQRIRASGVFSGSVGTAVGGASILVFWYGGRLVSEGQLSAGSLTSFLVYTMVVAVALSALSDLWGDFMRAAGSAERVFELIDRVPALPVSGGERPARLEGRIELRGVQFSYPSRRDVPVLKGLDCEIAPGEVVAVVGHSGAGKSTVAALLTRLYDPDGGKILLDGKDLRELDPQWLRQQIGLVSQEPLLFSCSIAENIRYGRADATQADVEAAARAANAHDFIAQFPKGYETLVGERGVQLSGGQRQRVAIARAVLKDPRLLVLDEATSALDAESEHLVKEALDRLMKGRTTMIIAHRLSTVMDANRVLVLQEGKIIQSGDHAALMSQEGLYRRLVERQFVAA